jgi:hypothetical protein
MRCERCQTTLESGEEREYHGQLLCEDCYMDALSPARACDPWAVHSAKSFERHGGTESSLTELQTRILTLLREAGGLEPEELCRRLEIKPSELEKQLAVLRHMEKVRAALRDGKKLVQLW